MSAFFIAINRDQSSFSPPLASHMMEQLAHFDVDGRELLVKDNFALGHCRHWTVPEEVGEKQPLYDLESDTWMLFHGRVDNRDTLFGLLGGLEDDSVSDATLVFELYKKRGKDCFDQIIGPFAMVFYHARDNKLIGARDCMGGRYLVYRVTEQTILIATTELALVAHPDLPFAFNEAKKVRCLINQEDAKPTSLISDLEPLLAGHLLEVKQDAQSSIEYFYLPDPNVRRPKISREEAATEFRRLLQQAVDRRMRSIRGVGAMLSGGMDSVPVAICAANHLRKRVEQQGDAQYLKSYTWVFDKTPESDERSFVVGVCEDHDIQANWINCDELWPQFDATMHTNPLIPFSVPYSAFNQRLLQQASDDGVSILLSGMGGDMLYTVDENLVYELLKAGRYKESLLQFRALVTRFKSRWTAAKRFLIKPLLPRRWVDRIGGDQQPPQYLTKEAQALLRAETNPLQSLIEKAIRPQQYKNVLGSLEGEDAAYGRYLDARYHIQRRYPFRDRELAEFMLSIPTQNLFFKDVERPIVRTAFRDSMREGLLRRRGKTNFNPVIKRGILKDTKYEQYLNSGSADWTRYVKHCYLLKTDDDSGHLLSLKWRLSYYEYWKSVCYTAAVKKLGSYNDE